MNGAGTETRTANGHGHDRIDSGIRYLGEGEKSDHINPKRVKLLTKILMDNKYGLLDELNFSRPFVSSADGIQAGGKTTDLGAVEGYTNAHNPMAEPVTKENVSPESPLNMQHLMDRQRQVLVTGQVKPISRSTRLKADRVRIYLDYYYSILERSIMVDSSEHVHSGVEGVYNPLQVIRNRKLKKKNNDMPVRELGISKTPFIAIRQFSTKPNKKMPWFVDITEKHTDMTWRTSHWDELVNPYGDTWFGTKKHSHRYRRIPHRPHIHKMRRGSEAKITDLSRDEQKINKTHQIESMHVPPQISVTSDDTSKESSEDVSVRSAVTDMDSNLSKSQNGYSINEKSTDTTTEDTDTSSAPFMNHSAEPQYNQKSRSPESSMHAPKLKRSEDNMQSHLDIAGGNIPRRDSSNSVFDQVSAASQASNAKNFDKSHSSKLDKVINKKPKMWQKPSSKFSKKVSEVTGTTVNILDLPEEIGGSLNDATVGIAGTVSKVLNPIESGASIHKAIGAYGSSGNLTGKEHKQHRGSSHERDVTKTPITKSENTSASSSGIMIGNIPYLSPAEAISNQKKSILLSDIPVQHLKSESRFQSIRENELDGESEVSSEQDLGLQFSTRNPNVDWQLQRYWQDMKYISSTMSIMKHRRLTHDLVKKKEIHKRNTIELDQDAETTVANTARVLNTYQDELIKVLKIGNNWTSRLLNDYSIRVDSLISSSDRILSDINTTLTLKLKLFQENSDRFGNRKVINAPRMTRLIYKIVEYMFVAFLWGIWLFMILFWHLKSIIIIVAKIIKNIFW
ncbi:hypothetical protein RNJ44_02917 [Nakaseomyces bracarensis]|uniref:Maintenance of telomere capping protein 4 n=1 Tax=Nakaseomyces bracarensis TaxID=273131 RepID=A0ABR4P182_9SACH